MTTLNEKSEMPTALESGDPTADVPKMIASSLGVGSVPCPPSPKISDPIDVKREPEPVISGSRTPPHGLADQTNFLPVKQLLGVFAGLSTALACSFLDQTIVATALPQISSDLHSGNQSAWVATAYLLTSLAFTPLYGRWSDVFGRKIVLLLSLAIFWLFSLACALSQTMIQLIVFRAFQGVGGGAIITMVLIIMSDVVSLKDRGKYQGINEAIIAVSNGVGPILGGVFSEYTTWRWCFWINLPLAGIAITTSILLVPFKPIPGGVREKLLRIDYAGSGLTIASSILILLGLNWGGVTYPWSSAPVLAPLIIGVVILCLFLIWEAKFAALPIIPVHIFRNKTVSGVYIVTLMNGMTFFSMLYYIPQFLQLVRGSSPVKSSLLMLPFLAVIPVFVFISGNVTSRTGQYRPFIICGFAIWTVAQGLQTTIDQETSNKKIIGFLVMAAVGAGQTFQTSLIAAQAAVPRHEMAVVTGVRNFVRLFGSTLSLAIAASIVNNTLRAALATLSLSDEQVQTIVNDPTSINKGTLSLTEEQRAVIIQGYTTGFQRMFYMTVTCTAIAFIASVTMIGQHELNRADDKQLKNEVKARLKAKKAAKQGRTIDDDMEAQTPVAHDEDLKSTAVSEINV